MKRIQTTIFGLSLLSFSVVFGQTSSHTVNPANVRQGESVEYCHQHKLLNQLMSDPAYAAQYAADQAYAAQREQEMLANPTRAVYKIPVVFHVLHNGGTENISRDQILDALAVMNRDFRLQNADAATVHFDFNSSNPNAVCEPSDAEIEFVLATKAPDGTCFSGITRTMNALTSDGSDGGDQVDAIVAGNDVYNGQWPGNKYLNIFVAAEIGGAAGYTTNPSSFSSTNMKNGIWVLHNYTGSIGTSNENTSRTLTHEAGHWLNLSHTWGSTNDPGVSCGSDNVNDTPETRGVTSCNLNENFCGVRANVENYMDYSYCSKMYTLGQVNRMRTALTITSTGRANICSTNNLNAVGANGSPTICAAEFSAAKTEICSGEQIQFTDESYNSVTGWSWTFAGGSPATSNVANPTVTYTTPGTYSVTLTATDGTTSVTETKTAYVTVLNAPESLPFFEGFEGISSFTGSSRWFVKDFGNNNDWEVTNTAGHSGTNSAKLTNFGQAAGNKDELVSTSIDLSGVTSQTGVTLSFRYAYRKRTSTNDDYLKVFLTNDCGDVWDQRKTLHGSTLSTSTATSAWTPTAADWITVHMTNVTSTNWVDNFRMKFTFESDGGNNIYLDDINLYTGGPSEAVVVGLEEEAAFANTSLYPNPADEEVNVSFTAASGQAVTVAVTDLMGHEIAKYAVNANEGANLVTISTETLAAGMYMIRLNGGVQTLQFVVK